jgi:hypothetical protein
VCHVGIIDAVTITNTPEAAPSTTIGTPIAKPSVVSRTSPLAAGFRSRFFADDDYRRFHARAPRYDSENAFFAEDFAELVDAGCPSIPTMSGCFCPGICRCRRACTSASPVVRSISRFWAQTRTSARDGVALHAQKPAVQRQIAQAEMKLEAVSALVEAATRPEPGVRPALRALAAKGFVTTTAREVVDIAVQVVGASSVSRRHELERLYRDVRTGSLHPPNTDAAPEAIGAVALGQGPQPAAGPAER